MPPFTIDVSCHSVNEARFDWFTQVSGSYRAFLRGMELLRDSGLPFTLKTKLMDWNKDEIDDLRTFTESFGQRFGYTTSLSPRLNGDCSSLQYRIAPQDLRTIESTGGFDSQEEPCAAAETLVPPETDRLYRCGCGTNTIHINAWGELGACTLAYESRVSLREHSLRKAVDMVFTFVRTKRYEEHSPCRSCHVHAFCDKQPTAARWEIGHPEAAIAYDCDIAVARAEKALRRNLLHPLWREASL